MLRRNVKKRPAKADMLEQLREKVLHMHGCEGCSQCAGQSALFKHAASCGGACEEKHCAVLKRICAAFLTRCEVCERGAAPNDRRCACGDGCPGQHAAPAAPGAENATAERAERGPPAETSGTFVGCDGNRLVDCAVCKRTVHRACGRVERGVCGQCLLRCAER